MSGAAQRSFHRQALAAERRLASASKCWTCGKRLVSSPRPRKRVSTGEALGFLVDNSGRWANVSIRCLFCRKCFCPKCAERHFSRTHVRVGAEVRVEEVRAYAVRVGRTTLAASLKKGEANDLAGRLRRTPGIGTSKGAR
jgi:hypothetical protein